MYPSRINGLLLVFLNGVRDLKNNLLHRYRPENAKCANNPYTAVNGGALTGRTAILPPVPVPSISTTKILDGTGRHAVDGTRHTRKDGDTSEAQEYLLKTFSSHAVVNPDDEIAEETMRDDMRRLASLQKANSRLIAGVSADAVTSQLRTTSSISRRRVRLVKDSSEDPAMRLASTTGRKRPPSWREDDRCSRTKLPCISRVSQGPFYTKIFGVSQAFSRRFESSKHVTKLAENGPKKSIFNPTYLHHRSVPCLSRAPPNETLWSVPVFRQGQLVEAPSRMTSSLHSADSSPARSPSPSPSTTIAAALGTFNRAHATPVLVQPAPSTLASPAGEPTHSHASNDWGFPSALLMPLSPQSDVSLKTFYKEITEAYGHNQHLVEEYEATHPRPDDGWDLSTTAPAAAQADVRERWHQEFGTSPDMGSPYQESTVGETDVFGEVRYLLVCPDKSFRRADHDIEWELQDRLQKKRTQLWITKLQDE
ncbi:hypothetical protein B0H10DRAFT_2184252, partial [Mycena sp. CBHHK59/15]